MEYSFEFSKRLIDSAEHLLNAHSEDDEAGRAILYLCSVSSEICLKAVLESTGYKVLEITRFNHRLRDLLNEVCSCRYVDTGRVASDLRAKEVIPNTANGTVGTILEAELSGGSVYPNKIRYGDKVCHYPPEANLNSAKMIYLWCVENKEKLTRGMEK